jgi:hypothetical protein
MVLVAGLSALAMAHGCAGVFPGCSCLRGNFDTDTIDPITGRQGDRRHAGLDGIPLGSLGVGRGLDVSCFGRLDPDVERVPSEASFGRQLDELMVWDDLPPVEPEAPGAAPAVGPGPWVLLGAGAAVAVAGGSSTPSAGRMDRASSADGAACLEVRRS